MFVMIGYFCTAMMASSCELVSVETPYPTLESCAVRMESFGAEHKAQGQWGGAACVKLDMGKPA